MTPEVDQSVVNEQPLRPFEQEDLEESTWRLGRQQLETLATSDKIKLQLRDHGLQGIIRHIDSAPNAEEELDKAMESPIFRAFTEQVLSTIGVERHENGLE